MKKNIGVSLATTFLLCILAACAPPHYTSADLATANARTVKGLVSKQSLGSFVLADADGNETIFRTGELTEYIPDGYRSLQGDTVRVTYTEVWESSGRAKLAVMQLEAINVPEANRAPTGPVAGEIVSFGKGSLSYMRSFYLRTAEREDALPVYVHDLNTSVDLAEMDKVTPAGGLATERWDDMIGKHFLVKMERMPVLRGNGYIYVAKSIAQVRGNAGEQVE